MPLLLLSGLAGLLLPTERHEALGASATRRSALQALLPSVAQATVYDDRIGSGFGGTGALRSDIGPSVLGDGVEILVTDLSYTELSACPPGFFIPEKGGPWTCLEISATALPGQISYCS